MNNPPMLEWVVNPNMAPEEIPTHGPSWHDWIARLAGNLRNLYSGRREEVFVASQLPWYPRQDNLDHWWVPELMVVFGRPQRQRDAYRQWEEDNVAPTVVLEVREDRFNFDFWQVGWEFSTDHGTQEMLHLIPQKGEVDIYLRSGKKNLLRPFRDHDGVYTSERLGITFDMRGDELRITLPNGRPLLTLAELEAERTQGERLLAIADRLTHGQATADDLAELQHLRELAG